MNESFTPPVAASASPSPLVTHSATQADVSCRVPLLVLFLGAGAWLVLSATFALLASIKFHSPAFLADTAWLTYGRVRPAAFNCGLYGFCVPAGLGLGLWLLARLGRTVLAGPAIVTAGAITWNIGVAVAVISILAGESSGYEHFEMPGYAAVILFVAYLLIGGWGIVTFRHRRLASAFVSKWYVLAALFWFPWILSTAAMLVLLFPVRGIAQPVIAWWFVQIFLVVWLGLMGLAIAFYLVARGAARELDNHNLALFVFWTLMLFGSWACIPFSAPVPAWMPVLSRSAGLLSVFTLVAAGLVLGRTALGKCQAMWGQTSGRFVLFGASAFLVAGMLRAIEHLVAPAFPLSFSWYRTGVTHIQWYGFFVMLAFGAAYQILPAVTGVNWKRPRLLRLHFWLSAAGIALLTLPLVIGGIIETARLVNPAIGFNDIVRANTHFLRISTIGDLLVLAGNALFFANVWSLLLAAYRDRVVSLYAGVTAELPDERPLKRANAGGVKV